MASVGQELRSSLAGWLWLRFPHKVVSDVSAICTSHLKTRLRLEDPCQSPLM